MNTAVNTPSTPRRRPPSGPADPGRLPARRTDRVDGGAPLVARSADGPVAARSGGGLSPAVRDEDRGAARPRFTAPRVVP